MIRVNNLSHSYGNEEIIKDIYFEINKGDLCALFGPNGTGKTTLFKCITRILNVNREAEILIDGASVFKMKPSEIAKRIAYVPQEHKPPFPFSVKEVVLMGRTPHLGGVFGPKEEDYDAVLEALELTGITNLANRSYSSLSGGQRQLVLLARAFAQDTDVLLLDEPTSNLDFKN